VNEGNNQKARSNAEIRAVRAKYGKLTAEINLHDRLYYKEHCPKISDFEYDCLKAELERLRGILAERGEEVQASAIGDDRIQGFESWAHFSPMMSLSNTYSREEFFQFGERVRAAVAPQNFSYVVEPKVDGVAINLIYKGGKFLKALTRGNGTVGDDVSANIRTIEDFPLRIESSSEVLEIRGEVYIDGTTFEKINESREKLGLEQFSNPRNLAAGTVKTLDANDVSARNLKLITYAIGHCSEKIVELQSEALEQLKKFGFPTQEKYWIAQTIELAWQCVGELEDFRRNFSYWTDGAVLKVNELHLHDLLGSTAKSPRWAIAYKFAPERAITRVKDIILQVGRTGVITPVADLEEVCLSGTNVSRATLHNADDMAKKDIRVGDYVVVEKAGEIIPAIVSVETGRRSALSKPFIFPKICPACGSELAQLDGEVAWRCQNSCCLPQVCRRIEHFVSRSAMDIDGLGILIIEKLISAGKLRDISDIYRLAFHDLASIEKLGTKSALKILDHIDRSKARPLWRLLHGLGICGIGEQTAKILAHNFRSVDAIISSDSAKLGALGGIGGKLSAAIVAFFVEPHNARIVDDLRKFGVSCVGASEADALENSKITNLENSGANDLENSKVDGFGTSEADALENSKVTNLKNSGANDLKNSGANDLKFSGKIFAITGTLPSMSRIEAIEKIEKLGGSVSNSLSKATNVLIAGENCGSKLKKAAASGVEIWDESVFLEKIAD
jgi:DNA ligase (NAD+)